ncbi:type II secretion system F family protein [Clostridium felsineum]|uniref:type II secretion system F family protein n=1 Tax=Clostridium felsineum TaxID=36839 RepID=UPI00214D6B59|nr:type II secretion system F family protein [Clostridium felsineum]MCR3759368.1 type II secretion system F family protein [Clostridium felsineum]
MEYVVLNTALLICMLIIAYYIRRTVKFRFSKQYRNIKKSNEGNKKATFSLVKYFNTHKIEKKLIVCGNPLKLTVNRYILLKILLAVILFITGFSYIGINLLGFNIALITAMLGFFSVDIVNYLSNEDDKNKIRLDLADVYDLISIQTVAGVNLGHALLEAHTVCKSKRFKKSLIRLAAKINLSKNIEMALNEFNNEYDMHEIDSFVALMKERLSSGISEQAIDDQSSALKAVNSFYTASETEKIDMYILIISMLLLGGIIAIVYYAIGVNLMQSAHSIFR